MYICPDCTTMDQKVNSGVLFKNDKKSLPKQPDYRGNVLVEEGKYSMSAWEANCNDPFSPNKGVMFQNPDKQDEKHPDLIGCINVNGTLHYLSAWERESKKGLHYYSIALRGWRNQFTGHPDDHISLACQQWVEKA